MPIKFHSLLFILCVGLLAPQLSGAAEITPQQCEAGAVGPVAVTVSTGTVLRKSIPRQLFGFNIVWRDFESGYVTSNGIVKQEIIDWLKPFQGALYRYPGGSPGNWFEWRKTTGPVSARPKVLFDWNQFYVAYFGVDEFLTFLEQVDGRGIYTHNIVGPYQKPLTGEEIAKESLDLMRYVSTFPATKCVGGVGCRLAYWELGNEMDWPPFNWSGPTYAARANEVIAAAKTEFPSAQFVVHGKTTPWNKPTTTEQANFNADVAKLTDSAVKTVAIHPYYDGYSVPEMDVYLKKLLSAWSAVGKTPDLLITENARWPSVPPSGVWQDNWTLSMGVGGAISSVDFLLNALDNPPVSGMVWHALGSSGPWQLFHWDKASNTIFPSPVYWGFRTIREAYLDDLVGVSPVTTVSGKYWGGYDLRLSAMKSSLGSKVSLLGVNRGPAPVTIKVNWATPSLPTDTFTVRGTTGESERVDNTVASPNLVTMAQKTYGPNATGNGEAWCVPPYTVFSIVRTPQ